ncbi:MAG: LysR family transcriptional regulator [Hyphomicrobiales bacterium]|nr:LysR family transcriptional regulator [Hyphomicrobiales bacterium]
MDWDDARVFLAVARAGQMLGAARKLGLDHATVSRRIAALEKALGVTLVERRTTGCGLTGQGEAFLPNAERMETEMLRAQAALSGADVAVSGNVRIGAPDGFGTFVLAPRLGALMDEHPGLTVQLVPLPRAFSLAKREADIAIAIDRPTEGRLVVRKLTDYTLSLYAARAYVARHPALCAASVASGHRVVAYVPDLLFSPSLDYLGEFGLADAPKFECAGMIGQMEAVRAGAGIGVLHDYAVRGDPDFVRICPGQQVRRSYWLVTHDDVKDFARVRLALDHIAGIAAQLAKRFAQP